jgi:CheY-like chemotaxis protein
VRQLDEPVLRQAAQLLGAFPLVASGTEGYRTAEVTLGGVDTAEVSSSTMESKRVPGLHFVGEVLDVTGWLGGYNFQWAWAQATRRVAWCEPDRRSMRARGARMDGSPRIVYLDSQIGEQCMQNANDITIRLLIVDDSGENAEAIVSTLRNSGIAVRPWRPQDAAELSQVLSSQAIDLVLASPSQGIPLPLVAQHIAASGGTSLVLLADRIDEDELVQASSHGIRALALRQRPEHLLAVVRDQWVDLQRVAACAASRRRCARPSAAAMR